MGLSQVANSVGDDEADPPVIGLLAQCRTLLDVGKRQKELLQTIRDENMDLHTQVKDGERSLTETLG